MSASANVQRWVVEPLESMGYCRQLDRLYVENETDQEFSLQLLEPPIVNRHLR